MAAPDPPVPPLIIRLFGPFEVQVNGCPLPRLRSRKGQSLLALLALRHGCEVERDWLAGLLWPDRPTSQALATMRRDLTDLRRALGKEAGRLRSPTPHSLCLDLTGAAVDVVAFDQAIGRGNEPSLAEAVAVYRGPLLEGCAEECIFEERQAREEAYLRALEKLADHARGKGDRAAAESYLRRVIAADALRESAQRALMETLAVGGSYAAAIQVYRALRQRLHREINAEPDAETTALFVRIRQEARDKAAAGLRTGRGAPWPGAPGPRTGISGEPPDGPGMARGDTAGTVPDGVRPAAAATNLPLQLTSFIGREDQMAEIEEWLATHRLVTLTGAGGCGKTRLALEVAVQVREAYPAGVWLVELAPLADPALVPQTVATALGVRELPGQALTQTLIDYLQPRRVLLVLDNCEHLVGACAMLAETLLERCPDLRLLATSREALAIGGERTYRVPSLSLPEAGWPAGRVGAELGSAVSQYEAVRLFMERAAAARPRFCLTEANAPVVVEVCRRLDGIPLAIELAAARVKALPVEQIAVRLEGMFRLLTAGSRTALPHHQTLRALIDWSYDLLNERERTLLRRVSVFAGGWSLEAAEAVAGGQWSVVSEVKGSGPELTTDHWPLATDVLDLLTSLVDKSLVIYDEQAGEGRYRLLETVRQYGRERLQEAGEGEAVRDRHRDWFVALAGEAEPKIRFGSEQAAWMDRLEQEHDNLRAALASSQETEGSAEAQLRLAGALAWFWIRRGHLAEGWRCITEALSRSSGAPAAVRGKALVGARQIAANRGDWTATETLSTQGLALGREAGDPWLTAVALAWSAGEAMGRTDYRQAQALFEESLDLARGLDDRLVATVPLCGLGELAVRRGEYELARALQQESLDLYRELEDTGGVACQLLRLGALVQRQGHYDAARAFYSESLTLYRELKDWQQISDSLASLAGLALTQGDLTTSRAHYEEAVALARELNLKSLAWWLSGLGQLACREGDYETATALHQESLAIWQERDAKWGLAKWGIAWAHLQLGIVAQQQGDYPKARALHAHSLLLQHKHGITYDIPWSLEQLAAVAEAVGQPQKAARLWGAAAALRETSGAFLSPGVRVEPDQRTAAVRTALVEAAFPAAWAEGRAMSLEEAIQVALEDCEIPSAGGRDS